MSTTTHQAVTTPDAPAPVGPYNQAVQAGGWLYCSGQIPLAPATGEMVGSGDVEAETRQVLRNLKAVLSAAGTEAAKVVRTTVYLVDLDDFQAVNAIRISEKSLLRDHHGMRPGCCRRHHHCL